MNPVTESLRGADREIEVALASFRRARRLRWSELIRPMHVDGEAETQEDTHVRYGLTALLRAERLVSHAATQLETPSDRDPAKHDFAPVVQSLELRFRTLLAELKHTPSPRRVVSHLKQARKAIPSSLRAL